MKVTAIIPDGIVKDVQEYSGGKNITECLVIALEDYFFHKKIDMLIEDLKKRIFEIRRWIQH